MWCVGMSLDDVEKEVIGKAYKYFHGNKTQTAKALGIAIRTLDAKMERYGIKKIESLYTQKRTCVEPVVKPSTKECSVPVQERKEVQEMSSKQTTKSD